MSYCNHFYKCGCFVRDTYQGNGVHIVFSKCKKHAKEFKRCSWEQWAKKMAPAQHKADLKMKRADRGWKP